MLPLITYAYLMFGIKRAPVHRRNLDRCFQGVMTSAIVDSYEEIAQKLKYILKIKLK